MRTQSQAVYGQHGSDATTVGRLFLWILQQVGRYASVRRFTGQNRKQDIRPTIES